MEQPNHHQGHAQGQHYAQSMSAALPDATEAAFYHQNIPQPGSCDIKPRLNKEQHDFLEDHYKQQTKPNTSTKKGFADHLNVSLDKVNASIQQKCVSKARANSITELVSEPTRKIEARCQETARSTKPCSGIPIRAPRFGLGALAIPAIWPICCCDATLFGRGPGFEWTRYLANAATSGFQRTAHSVFRRSWAGDATDRQQLRLASSAGGRFLRLAARLEPTHAHARELQRYLT